MDFDVVGRVNGSRAGRVTGHPGSLYPFASTILRSPPPRSAQPASAANLRPNSGVRRLTDNDSENRFGAPQPTGSERRAMKPVFLGGQCMVGDLGTALLAVFRNESTEHLQNRTDGLAK